MIYIPDLTVCLLALGLCLGPATLSSANVTSRNEDESAINASTIRILAPDVADARRAVDCATVCSLDLTPTDDCVPVIPLSAFHLPKGLRAETMPPAMARRWAEVMTVHYPPAKHGWFADYGQYGPALVTRLEAIRNSGLPCR